MTAAVPPTRPKMTRDEVLALLAARHPEVNVPEVLAAAGVLIVGVRGYYRDSLGKVGENDRRIYDDALFVISAGRMEAFNANTDPNGYRPGKGTGAGKGMAVLQAGVWPVYRLDKHKGEYLAVCQRAGPVVVMRDGTPPYPDRGNFGINIHKGGLNGTSSEGCQTLPPSQWPVFLSAVIRAVAGVWGERTAKATLTYVLLEGV